MSVATVSNVLNGSGRVSAKTREHVMEVAARLRYRPSKLARALTSDQIGTVGVLTNDVYGRFCFPVLAGLAAELATSGTLISLAVNTSETLTPSAGIEEFLRQGHDAVVVVGRRADKSVGVDLGWLGVPVVYVLAPAAGDAPSIYPDDQSGAAEAALALKRLGRVRPVMITGPERHLAARQRATGFRSTFGAEAPVLYGQWNERWGRVAMQHLLEVGDVPDAVLCGSDQIARGVLDHLRQYGKRVPEDVSVIGFDNWQVVAENAQPPLSSVDQQLHELGVAAAQTVKSMTRGIAVQSDPIYLPCKFVRRESCGTAV